MSRILFPEGKQSRWINGILKRESKHTSELAEICEVNPRTFSDWKREKYNISKIALLKLCKYFDIPKPSGITYLSDFWYVSKGAGKGALKRMELYGPLGTKESRKKGGHISQLRRKENPEKYRLLGCNIAKRFNLLSQSQSLAELTGIILGDGGITNYQLSVTLGRKTDREYAHFVSQLMKNVFGESPRWYENKNKNTINLCISGVNLTRELSKWGLGTGDKIRRQVSFPSWIWKDIEYQKACVRGLMDTDGGVYFHTHTTKGIQYRNFGICFTSFSEPLLLCVSKTLNNFNIKHSLKKNRIYVYNMATIKTYFDIFDSNNPKHKQKLQHHLSNSRRLN